MQTGEAQTEWRECPCGSSLQASTGTRVRRRGDLFNVPKAREEGNTEFKGYCKTDLYQRLLINYLWGSPTVPNPLGCLRLGNMVAGFHCFHWSNKILPFIHRLSTAGEWENLVQTASSEFILPGSWDQSPFLQLKNKHIKEMNASLLREHDTMRSNR